jgi:hypothetical protein
VAPILDAEPRAANVAHGRMPDMDNTEADKLKAEIAELRRRSDAIVQQSYELKARMDKLEARSKVLTERTLKAIRPLDEP